MLIEPKVLKGFRDFLPAKEAQRKKIINILEATFINFGFQAIDTPVLEYKDVLLGKAGGETDKQLYSFKDNGKRDVAMRFDLTVPFARFMATYSSIRPRGSTASTLAWGRAMTCTETTSPTRVAAV